MKKITSMKRKSIKIIAGIIAVIILVAGAMIAYVRFALPDVGPAPDLKVELTAERIQRGEYLANHVFLCMDCHAERDWTKFSGPPMAGTLGSGGELFSHDLGFPGVFYAPNITPAGVGDWTDGELFRAITSGVAKNGRALFPIMPYLGLGQADREDILDVIAYIRTLDPVEKEIPAPQYDFPFNLIINTMPKKPEFHPRPVDKPAYGNYLAGGCIECHTGVKNGQIIPEKTFAGGREFPLLSGGTVRSANITPDKETGIGNWTEETFIQRFKMYVDSSYVPHNVGPNEFNSYMPWIMYGGMREEDLSAVYHFLMSLEPKKNLVTKFTPGLN